METRQCDGCGEIKPIGDFYKWNQRGRATTAYSRLCKRCYVDDAVRERRKLENAAKRARVLELASQGLKRCATCGEVKRYDEFVRTSNSTDGRDSNCKSCKREVDKEYRQRTEVKEAHKVRARNYVRSNRWRWIAHNAARRSVRSAVAQGKLPSISSCVCADCGAPAAEYHHKSYDQEHWLDVVPLCRSCHVRRHAHP